MLLDREHVPGADADERAQHRDRDRPPRTEQELGDEAEAGDAEERKTLFPAVRKALDADQREALGQQMEAMAMDLQAGKRAPRMQVPREITEAAPLPEG